MSSCDWHDTIRSARWSGRVGRVDESPTSQQLVSAWLSLREVADRLGVSPNKVRQMVRDNQLAALRHEGAREPEVPAELLLDDTVVKGLPGTLTVLSDSGYDEEESIRWLFTADDTLPGRPIDALRENRGTEVRRRAQALAF
jgi:excisionase family DNA binding protein